MRTSTLLLVDLALRHGGVRAASRASGAPISTLSTAIARFEDSQSQSLMRRTETGLVPTVASERLAPAIARMAALTRSLHRLTEDQLPAHPVSFLGLFRMAEALRHGSIRGASIAMGLSQPQLTRQISQIETNLGTTLFLRERRGISALPEGTAILALIERLEVEWRAFSGEFEPIHSLASRRLSLGTIIPATAEGHLARFIGEFVSTLYFEKGLNIHLASAIAEDLLAGLDSGRFDAAIIDSDLRDPGYRQQTLLHGPVSLMGHDLPSDLSNRADLTYALTRRPFVLQSKRSGLRQCAERFLDSYAQSEWRKQITLIENDSLPVIVNMVGSGRFNSLLPRHVGSRMTVGTVVDLPDQFDQILQLTWRRSPRTERLAQLVLATCCGAKPAR